MWSLGVTISGEGLVDSRKPTLLFKGNQFRGQEPPSRTYDVSPDGSTFFMIRDEQASDQIRVIFNFFDLLRQRVP